MGFVGVAVYARPDAGTSIITATIYTSYTYIDRQTWGRCLATARAKFPRVVSTMIRSCLHGMVVCVVISHQ